MKIKKIKIFLLQQTTIILIKRLKIYTKKIKLYYYNTTLERRKTTLREAIIDIYMCVLSDKFKSGYSYLDLNQKQFNKYKCLSNGVC